MNFISITLPSLIRQWNYFMSKCMFQSMIGIAQRINSCRHFKDRFCYIPKVYIESLSIFYWMFRIFRVFFCEKSKPVFWLNGSSALKNMYHIDQCAFCISVLFGAGNFQLCFSSSTYSLKLQIFQILMP